MIRVSPARHLICVLACATTACTTVGPDYTQPESTTPENWSEYVRDDFEFTPQDSAEWWQNFSDPVLDELIRTAFRENNNVRIAGLRVLESRAALGIAIGSQYPQTQVAAGDALAIQASESNANTGAGDLNYQQYNLGISAAWEIDFWGRFRRGIESADAALLASVANYDDALVLLAAQVADAYMLIRTTEEQLRIARANIVLQQRSFDIVEVLYRNGSSNELDVERAETLLLSTQATIPGFEITLHQATNALANLLGLPPTDLSGMLSGSSGLPESPSRIMVGVPADILRQRPDVRRAELQAMAQNAQVGVATADLYPSFSINGTLGLAASGGTNTTATGDSGFGELFSSDSLTYSVGPSFVWPFFNYDRIENNIRVQDARLQQALIGYREAVIRAAREVEDAMVAYSGSQRSDVILGRAVASAIRAENLATIRYKEGFADYQRVIDAQQALVAQQQRYVSNKGFALRSLVQVYRALGGGWQSAATGFVDPATAEEMRERIDWGDLLETDRTRIMEEHDERTRN